MREYILNQWCATYFVCLWNPTFYNKYFMILRLCTTVLEKDRKLKLSIYPMMNIVGFTLSMGVGKESVLGVQIPPDIKDKTILK